MLTNPQKKKGADDQALRCRSSPEARRLADYTVPEVRRDTKTHSKVPNKGSVHCYTQGHASRGSVARVGRSPRSGHGRRGRGRAACLALTMGGAAEGRPPTHWVWAAIMDLMSSNWMAVTRRRGCLTASSCPLGPRMAAQLNPTTCPRRRSWPPPAASRTVRPH